MVKIHLEVVSCKQCPKMDLRNPWSSDGWDRMIDWHCTAADRGIAGSVEWHEERRITIPDWCPLTCKECTDVKQSDDKK
jgi:hypothetical protein